MDLSQFKTTDDQGNETEAPRPETKTWADVEACITHNNGGNCAAVCAHIRMAIAGDDWDWYEQYKAWLAKCEEIERYNAGRTEDDEGNLPPVKPLPPMPEQPVVDLDKVRGLRVQQLKLATDKALSPIMANYPSAEIVSWDIQHLQAAGEMDGTVLIDRIAAQRSAITNEELKTRITEKNNDWQQLAGDVIGHRQHTEDQLYAAITLDELLAVEVAL